MTEEEALEYVRTILDDMLGIEPADVVLTAGLRDDLGMDSLDAMELVESVQRLFEVRLTNDEVNSVVTVQDMVDVMLRRSAMLGAAT